MPASEKPKAASAILVGGILAGVLDLIDAFVVFGIMGVPPLTILKSIASGLLGREAFQGGLSIAALGLVLHFVIAFLIATVYFVASLKMPLLIEKPVLCGLAFGVMAYFVMNYVVLPLSAFPGKSEFSMLLFLNGVVGHALLVGVPIALSTTRSAGRSI